MYDPTVGRFFTEDPSDFEAGDLNLYRYVKNDPLNNTDPTGLYSYSGVLNTTFNLQSYAPSVMADLAGLRGVFGSTSTSTYWPTSGVASYTGFSVDYGGTTQYSPTSAPVYTGGITGLGSSLSSGLTTTLNSWTNTTTVPSSSYSWYDNGPALSQAGGGEQTWGPQAGPYSGVTLAPSPPGATLTDLGAVLAGTGTSDKSKAEAKRIAGAIQNTFSGGYSYSWAAWGGVKNLVSWTTDGYLGGDERCGGYYCYEWAYAFKNAFNIESSGDCFTAKVEEAATLEGKVHYWLAITSKDAPYTTIYVDDGFMNGNKVHALRPEGGKYKYQPVLSKPEAECSPPPASGANRPEPLDRYLRTEIFGPTLP
jgi:hypothetical protein